MPVPRMCDIAIKGYETVPTEKGEYTGARRHSYAALDCLFAAYDVRIIYGSGQNSAYGLKKRFSDFENLHWELREALENSGFDVDLPMLPPKKFCGSMEPEFVEQRLWQLQEYTSACDALVAWSY